MGPAARTNTNVRAQSKKTGNCLSSVLHAQSSIVGSRRQANARAEVQGRRLWHSCASRQELMSPFSLLEELLRFRRVKAGETSVLADYSHDDLCRAIEDNIHALLNSFEKYKHIAYLVQGPRDQGVDVLLKGKPTEEDGHRFIGLQVKS